MKQHFHAFQNWITLYLYYDYTITFTFISLRKYLSLLNNITQYISVAWSNIIMRFRIGLRRIIFCITIILRRIIGLDYIFNKIVRCFSFSIYIYILSCQYDGFHYNIFVLYKNILEVKRARKYIFIRMVDSFYSYIYIYSIYGMYNSIQFSSVEDY